MGRISRTKSYAIASSIVQENQQQTPPSITCTTFNILAPIYKRLNHEDQSCRESDYKACWLTRNQRILDWLLYERSSIICLQEFWIGNDEFVNLYDKRLGDAGYINLKLGRTNNRGDGLLIAVQKEYFTVVNHKELHFNDCGDRVAQLLHLELAFPFSQCQNSDVRHEILIVNTHLLFPHDSSLCLVRLHQVYKILQYVESYQKEYQLKPLPIMLCGDWNGSKRGHVYQFLRSQGFVSSYDAAHHYTDADAHKYLLRRASLTERDAFAFLKVDNEDCITYSGFCEALRQLNLIGHCHGLSAEETKDLWVQADINGNGVIDYKEFLQQIWNSTGSDQRDDKNGQHDDEANDSEEDQTIGFNVKSAVFFPPEVEKSRWPEDYSLSDHARLTVVFSPTRMSCHPPK
ncbi:hypothetical protein AAZX31_02G208100 [Glycine max]|uniref:EF-hand domain-containing protein n=1 Tax=Glycine max TaxID=3847 RepID=A0A0R0L5R3_SOYBN|nr:uncharacterized calcium-binding protein At1g02270 isoform X3 [Glycine max]KAH1061587.1 hypothetical protein GYH30_004858 [Glycine max]KRH72601.1 hypothetical protein GLYMA_02G222200v4 [Glycine max]|eukprot:XP_006575391.1 uncharacterized calcium-binding protein At1g02270 isoform X2 [Glycine max]